MLRPAPGSWTYQVVITDYWGAVTLYPIPGSVVATSPTPDQLQQLSQSGQIAALMVSMSGGHQPQT